MMMYVETFYGRHHDRPFTMKKIQVDFCIREQTVPGYKNWPRDGGAFSGDFTIHLSPQSRALETEMLKAPLSAGPAGAEPTNDRYISIKLSDHVLTTIDLKPSVITN